MFPEGTHTTASVADAAYHRPHFRGRTTQRGGRNVDLSGLFSDPLLLPALLIAAGQVTCRLLPLLSKRANKLAVRLIRAKRSK